jgi:Na+-translocating ferredoxin:NAD+ oxidoreductase RnfG subunit
VKKGLAVTSVLLALVLVRPSAGAVLLTQDQALKQMFPDPAKVVPEAHVLTPAQAESIKVRLGGKWTLFKSLAKGEESKETDSLMFYFAKKDGKKTGVALIEVQPGLWGPQKCIVALDLTGRVTNLAVMSYLGERCRPIATRRFLEQFIGKTSESPLTVGKDVDAVSGATISSRTTAFTVKKVVALYETVFPPAEKKGE